MRFAESEKGIKTVNRIAVHKTKVIPIYQDDSFLSLLELLEQYYNTIQRV